MSWTVNKVQTQEQIYKLIFDLIFFWLDGGPSINWAGAGARGWGSEFIFSPEFLFLLVRSACKNLKPYINPFWDFNIGGMKKKKTKTSGIIPKIVATFVYASSQGQRMHSARTNMFQPLSLKQNKKKVICLLESKVFF